MREQEPLVQGHIAQFIHQLKARTDDSGPTKIDVNRWLDLLCFDVLSDLTLGQSFNGLETGETHPFIDMVYKGCAMTPVLLMEWDYSIIKWALKLMSKVPRIKRAQEGDKAEQLARIKRRKEVGDDSRKDFMSYVCCYITAKSAS